MTKPRSRPCDAEGAAVPRPAMRCPSAMLDRRERCIHRVWHAWPTRRAGPECGSNDLAGGRRPCHQSTMTLQPAPESPIPYGSRRRHRFAAGSDSKALAGLIAEKRVTPDIAVTCWDRTDGAGAQAMGVVSAM